MRLEKLVNKLLAYPLDTEVYMEGCSGQCFNIGLGSFECPGEDDAAEIHAVEEFNEKEEPPRLILRRKS